MRREDRTNRVPVTTTNDEFVDILQVQQLLINDTRRELPPAPLHLSQPHGRIADTFAPSAGYYYGAYQQPQTSTSVDDLVAMWFAGPSASGEKLLIYYQNVLSSIPRHTNIILIVDFRT